MGPRRYRLRRRLTLLALLGILIGLGWIASDQFNKIESIKIRKVVVTPTQYCSTKTIQKVKQELYGRNLIWVWSNPGFHKKWLRQLPQAEAVRFHISFPSTLKIQIIEKKPILILQGERYSGLISEDGTWLQTVPYISTRNTLRIVQGISPKWAYPRLDPIAVKKIKTLQTQLNPAPHLATAIILFKTLSLQPSPSQDEVVLITPPHTIIKLGSLENLPQKIDALNAFLLRQSGSCISKNATSIDLRISDKVFVYYGQ